MNPSEPPVERQDESDFRGSIQALGEHWANTHAHGAIQNNGQLSHASYSPGPSIPGTPTGGDGLLSFEQAYDQTSTKRRLSVKSMIRLWHDSSADLDEVSRRVYTCCGAGDRVGGDDPGEGDGVR